MDDRSQLPYRGEPTGAPDATSWLGIDGYDSAVEIGRGGFATVFRARQRRLHRDVAIKVIMGTLDEQAVGRFEREQRAMGALSAHPNIVTVFDSGVTPSGHPYLVMEFMPGGTLADRLEREGTYSWLEAGHLAVSLCGALQAAHDAGILHRDIKPANVLLSSFGVPVLADFGIASVASGVTTRTGNVTASLAFAPPEVLLGERATTASDVYALVATLSTLLSGAPPFVRATDESLAPVMLRTLSDPAPDHRVLGVPDAMCLVIEQGLAKDPTQRPSSPAALGRLIGACLDDHGRRTPPAVAVEPSMDPDPSTDGSLTRAAITPTHVAPEPSEIREALMSAIPDLSLAVGYVRRSRPFGRVVGTYDGQRAVGTPISTPWGLVVGLDGSIVFTERQRHRVRMIDAMGVLLTVAGTGERGMTPGSGSAVESMLNEPRDLAIGADGSIFVADSGNHRVCRISPDGTLTTVAGCGERGYSGDGGQALKARFALPSGIAVTPEGDLFVADALNHRVRRVAPDGIITTLAPWNDDAHAQHTRSLGVVSTPTGIALSGHADLYVTEASADLIHFVRADGRFQTVAGTGVRGFSGDAGFATQAQLSAPQSLAVARDGTVVIADTGNNRIRCITPRGTILTIAGTGIGDREFESTTLDTPAVRVGLRQPHGVAASADGDVFVADTMNDRIIRIDLHGQATLVAGTALE